MSQPKQFVPNLSEYRPAAQLVQLAEPVKAENCPAAQSVQDACGAPAPENLPTGQFMHAVEPVALWYEPLAQFKQAPAAAEEKDPAGQGPQVPAPAPDLN